MTFFAIRASGLLDLHEVELDRRGAPEDADEHAAASPFPASLPRPTPLKSWNGPSITFTCSPCSKRTFGFGLTAPSSIWCVISRTSASEMEGMELGSVAPPRNPVTFGVDFTMCQVSLLRRMLTRM
jgi:hypothetical protein